MERIYWVDAIKAIGIFFVFWGHNTAIPPGIQKYIASFHMPLFFFLSGLFFRDAVTKSRVSEFFRKKIHTRLVPYFFFGFFTYFVWLITYFLIKYNYLSSTKIHVNPLKPIVGMLYGNLIGDWLAHNAVLWFLACLLITEILFFLVRKTIAKEKYLLISLLIISIIGCINSTLKHPRLPFSADIALIAVGFYGLAYIFRKQLFELDFNYFALLLIFICGLIVSRVNGWVNMSANVYGNFFLFYVAALCNIMFWIGVAKKIPRMKLIKYVGENTLSLFLLQYIAFSAISGILRFVFHYSVHANINLTYSVLFSASSIVILFPLIFVLNRRFAFFLGH